MKKRVYSTEFKSEAVRLSYQRENIKELADELGVQVQRIYKWRAGQKTKASPKATIKLETDSIEVKRLRKALKKKNYLQVTIGIALLLKNKKFVGHFTLKR